MNCIINPSWFYWVNVANGLRDTLTLVAVLLGIAEIIMCVWAGISYGISWGPDDKDRKIAKAFIKPIIICGIVFLISLLAMIFVPSRNTLIEMQVARYATYENAEWTVDAIKSAVDYIVNAIATVNGG